MIIVCIQMFIAISLGASVGRQDFRNVVVSCSLCEAFGRIVIHLRGLESILASPSAHQDAAISSSSEQGFDSFQVTSVGRQMQRREPLQGQPAVAFCSTYIFIALVHVYAWSMH